MKNNIQRRGTGPDVTGRREAGRIEGDLKKKILPTDQYSRSGRNEWIPLRGLRKEWD
jgi:hypothetical protein